MARRRIRFLFAAPAAALLIATAIAPAGAANARALARNVILLVDDGAGYAAHELGSLYANGDRNGEPYQGFPFQFAMSTYSHGDVPMGSCGELTGYDPALAWSAWDYVLQDPTDSAAAATAMATGVKTYDAAIGVDCAGDRVDNIVETYEELGKATGVVTSVPISHATPAAFVAHHVDRDANTAIATQMFMSSATDVIMGGGHPYYDKYGVAKAKPGWVWIDQPTWTALVNGTPAADADGDGDGDAWSLVQTRAEFQALASGDAPARVAGIAQTRRSLQEDRVDVVPGVVVAPWSVPFVASVPTLSEMAAGALNVLDDDPDGFFLMIEGGATDWAAHDAQPGLMLEEELAFNDTVDVVLQWVDEHSNWGETLVIVTSDHETGYLTGPGSGDMGDGPTWTQVTDQGAGVLPETQFNTDGHTNSLVPLYAKGDSARMLRRFVDGTDPIRGRYLDNTDIHGLLLVAAGLAE